MKQQQPAKADKLQSSPLTTKITTIIVILTTRTGADSELLWIKWWQIGRSLTGDGTLELALGNRLFFQGFIYTLFLYSLLSPLTLGASSFSRGG